MLMGVFPIQSNTSIADEWLINGETGILVPPEDPDIIEQAIRKSLNDDELVDKAALINYNLIKEKLNYNDIQHSVVKMYEDCDKQINSTS